MKIAILSGKGGTGKTFISVNLAVAAKESVYIDCDVEEPNGHLFLKPENILSRAVSVKIPAIDESICDGCRECVNFCNFNALAFIKKVVVFEDICHSCGGCVYICSNGAIDEKAKNIGTIEIGNRDDITVISGRLNIGSMSGVPIIKKMLSLIQNNDKYTFIDCPPGSGCSVMESIKDADYCLLVTEPTIFGIHNMKMILKLIELFKKPYGIIINKTITGNNIADDFCKEEKLSVLVKIPFDKKIGSINSNGDVLVLKNEKYLDIFQTLLKNITREANNETIANS